MSGETTTATPGRSAGVEVRSIDYVPRTSDTARSGSRARLWFMSNAQIATLAVGTSRVTGRRQPDLVDHRDPRGSLSARSSWRHSSQGPQLGLPQMIQSRPQFGYIGALLVCLFAFLQYAGFNVFNTASWPVRLLVLPVHTPSTFRGFNTLWMIVVPTVVGAVVALYGYDLIHRMERYLVSRHPSWSYRGSGHGLRVHPLCRFRRTRSASDTSSRRWRSSLSWASPPATRSPGPSTCPTTPATSGRRRPRPAAPSAGRSGAVRSAAQVDHVARRLPRGNSGHEKTSTRAISVIGDQAGGR